MAALWWFPYTAWYLKHYKHQTITIDEENGLLINSHHKDYPLKISDITIAKYKREKMILSSRSRFPVPMPEASYG